MVLDQSFVVMIILHVQQQLCVYFVCVINPLLNRIHFSTTFFFLALNSCYRRLSPNKSWQIIIFILYGMKQLLLIIASFIVAAAKL